MSLTIPLLLAAAWVPDDGDEPPPREVAKELGLEWYRTGHGAPQKGMQGYWERVWVKGDDWAVLRLLGLYPDGDLIPEEFARL